MAISHLWIGPSQVTSFSPLGVTLLAIVHNSKCYTNWGVYSWPWQSFAMGTVDRPLLLTSIRCIPVEVQLCCVREIKRKVPCKTPWRPIGRLEKRLYSFITLGTRWEWMVHVMPWPLNPRERDMEPTTQEAGWAPVLLELCINSKFSLLETINVTNGDLWNQSHAVIELIFHRIRVSLLTADASINPLALELDI